MSRYIAAYDISNDSSRVRVARLLEQFGERLQRSVFEVWLDSEELADLQRRVAPHLGEFDQFEMIPIDVARHRPRWNWGSHEPRIEAVMVLGR